MVKMVAFNTDAAAVAGVGIEALSLETFFHSPAPKGMAIVDVYQTPGVVLANDADWTLTIDGLPTRYNWTAEELDPATFAGGKGRLPSPITIRPGALVQMVWAAQGAAQANQVKLLYELIR